VSDDQIEASRFYAVPLAGRMECPQCGRMLVWGRGAGKSEHRYWNGLSSVMRCPDCGVRYQLGILAWPIGPNGATRLAPDQKATVRQLAEIRQRAGGFWARNRKSKADPLVNRFVREGCCCGPLAWRKECPVHGRMGHDPEGGEGGESGG